MDCATCQGPTDGYKCDMCGEESVSHTDDHGCGGEHCLPKCAGCDEAETNCTCA